MKELSIVRIFHMTKFKYQLEESLWSQAYKDDLIYSWRGEILGICKAAGVKKCNDVGNRAELIYK